MTCLNGYFHDTTFPSLAEQLLANPQGGAVAVWASSTLTLPAPQLAMACGARGSCSATRRCGFTDVLQLTAAGRN